MSLFSGVRSTSTEFGCEPFGEDEVVRAEGLSKTYQQGLNTVQALLNVNMILRHGELTALTGPSGSGKSTLLNILGLLDSPDEGVLVLDGIQVDFHNTKGKEKLRSRSLGFVFQSFNLISVLSAVENVELPLLLHPMERKERRERAVDMLVSVGLGDRLGHRPHQLSAGQQQRVAVARALVARPALVLADEPTANLDSQSAFGLLDLMQRLNVELDTTFLFSTHDRRLVDRVCTVMVLQDGRLTS